MLRTLLPVFFLLFAGRSAAQVKTFSGPPKSGYFGTTVTVLKNGNYVITDPDYDNRTGAVYLYNCKTHALISRLTGTYQGDMVGSHGVIELANGNFIVRSIYWLGNGAARESGAVTWGSGTAGVSGVVSASNSLVSAWPETNVGVGDIAALPNGNYVVCSPAWMSGLPNESGAVTFCNGTTGTSGLISASNSLTGSSWTGSKGIAVLSNGNYVVLTPTWNGGTGAVTWANGTTGIAGHISASNSLVGTYIKDMVGDGGVTTLPNGNYVVNSPRWSTTTTNELGAATFCNGTSGTSGVVSAANSLVGSVDYDQVGFGGITVLPNSNYLVNSYEFRNNGRAEAGAVTLGSGTTGVSGVVSASNSLVGDSAHSKVGLQGITVLTNGNYVVNSPEWQNGRHLRAGAVTWCNAATGRTGSVTVINSLVGDTAEESIGSAGVTALTNGHYVVSSPFWAAGSSQSLTNFGAATWGNGSTGITGNVTAANSLVGKKYYFHIASGGATALANGHYVVSSPEWADSSYFQLGAVTWCDGTKPTSSRVSDSNSLTGSHFNDRVGFTGITPLTNGHYIVTSHLWGGGRAVQTGAVTWCNGNGSTSAIVSPSNSLVGSKSTDNVGFVYPWGNGVTPLKNGDYVVASTEWDNGTARDAGAVTLGNGTGGTVGPVTAANSLVGTQTDDRVGDGPVMALPNGDYLIRNDAWANGSASHAGAVTWGSRVNGATGPVTSCNSVVGRGTMSSVILEMAVGYDSIGDQAIVGMPRDNMYSVYKRGTNALVTTTSSATIDIAGAALVHFVDTSCLLIASVGPAGASKVAGSTRATALIQGVTPNYNGQAYVRRYHDIAPVTAPNTATARITLYYTQADFDDYNLNNAAMPDLPAGPSDFAGIAALRITQEHGSSASGLPGTFTGWAGIGPAIVVQDPDDAAVIWNAEERRWEVSLDVSGFSGFFAHTGDKLTVANSAHNSGDVSLSPVPALSSVQVECRNEQLTGTDAIITDMQGRELRRVILNRTTRVDIGAWPSGIYMMKLANGDVLRIVKQ